MSTLMQRCRSGLKAMLPLIASQLPSNAKPTSSPLPFTTGDPEFPPVMSLLVIKHTGTVPFCAYCP